MRRFIFTLGVLTLFAGAADAGPIRDRLANRFPRLAAVLRPASARQAILPPVIVRPVATAATVFRVMTGRGAVCSGGNCR